MPGVPIDQRNLDPIGSDAQLVKPARRADRAPQSGKAAADDDDVVHWLLSFSR